MLKKLCRTWISSIRKLYKTFGRMLIFIIFIRPMHERDLIVIFLKSSLISFSNDNPICSKSTFFQELKGYYPCRKCSVCQVNCIKERRVCEFQSNIASTRYRIDSFITCSSKNVVYLLECSCGLQYVGRTIRTLQVRVNGHLGNIRRGFPGHSASKHFVRAHDKNPSGLRILGIDKYIPHWRGSNIQREISRLETRWIYNLKSYAPNGLNIDCNINCLIKNS